MTVNELKTQLISKPSYFRESYKTISERFNVSMGTVHEAFADPELLKAKSDYYGKRSGKPFFNETVLLKAELEKLRRQLNLIKQDTKALEKPKRDLPKPFTSGDPKNVLVIGDTHVPFEREGYLEFCRQTQEKFNCGTVVHIGDVVDNHFSSFHETNPDGLSAGNELDVALEALKAWNQVFPKAKACFGNHDLLIERQAFSAGVSRRWIRDFNEVLGLPGWEFDLEHEIEGVIYTHGTGTSGENGAYNKALNRRKSIVSGHLHTIANVKWNVSETDRIFSMQVGCGINDKAYAFEYAKGIAKKSIISCGVVLAGELPIVIPMNL